MTIQQFLRPQIAVTHHTNDDGDTVWRAVIPDPGTETGWATITEGTIPGDVADRINPADVAEQTIIQAGIDALRNGGT